MNWNIIVCVEGRQIIYFDMLIIIIFRIKIILIFTSQMLSNNLYMKTWMNGLQLEDFQEIIISTNNEQTVKVLKNFFIKS